MQTITFTKEELNIIINHLRFNTGRFQIIELIYKNILKQNEPTTTKQN